MKKLFILVLFLISVQSFGQTKKYFERMSVAGVVDSGYIKLPIGDSVFLYADNSFISFTVRYYVERNLPLPQAFSNFQLCADGVYRNPLAITGVKVTVIPINANASANLTLTSQPNSEQPLANSQRSAVKIFSGGYTEFRLTAIVLANSASANSPRIYLQYSTDATNWTGDGTAGNISLTTTGAKETSWITIPTTGDIYVRVAQNGGNGTASPQLGNVTIQLR